MSRTLRIIALGLLACAPAAPLLAEPTPAPPAWQDGSSIYLEMGQKPAPAPPPKTSDRTALQAAFTIEPRSAPAPIVDAAVVPAALHKPATAAAAATPKSDVRHLAPPSAKRAAGLNERLARGQQSAARSPAERLADIGVPVDSMYTICTALAVVIGAFLIFAWALRRGGRAANGRRGSLPADVVSVIGRVPLAARQFAELLRVGNKLVLVSLTPTGPKTITEVTDPVEVDRLLGLCQQHDPHSTSRAFEQVFRQLSSEATPGGFLGNESLSASLGSPAAAYRAHGGRARG
jgi:flagellar biogenesis protein FliO